MLDMEYLCGRRRTGWAPVLVTLAVVLAVNDGGVTASSISALQRFSQSQFTFSLDLYSALAATGQNVSDTQSNLLFSPFGVSAVLGMIFLGTGAGSSTSLQLRSALQLNSLGFNDVHSSYKTVLSKLGDPYYAGVMAAASGVFQQKGLSISDKYKRALDEFYSSTMQLVDFLQQPQGAVDAINAWASNVTHGNFSSLIQQPLDPSARLLVVNGLAFRSQWLFRFDPAMTFDKGLFYTTTKKRFEIPMMIGRFKIPIGYSSDLECRIAELPFSSRRISLFIILPDDVDCGLDKLETNMSSDNIKTLFSTLKDEMVNIRLPRFRLQHQVGLRQALKSLGINDVFDSKLADLSGMSTDQLHVHQVVHNTFLEIGEDGVEATGNTMSGLNRIGAFGEKYFEVDHPFVFFLWDYHSGILLFLGRVTTPEPWTL